MWVYCADPSGSCWSPDVWDHKTGECWLKQQEGWDGRPENLVVNHVGLYSAEHLAEHPTSPDHVQWTSGYLAVGTHTVAEVLVR